MTYQREPLGESGEIGILQTNHGLDYPLSLEEYDLKEGKAGETPAALETIVNRIQAGIDLEKGPLLKLGLFHLEDGDRLLIVIHHLVIDGISWRILFEDLDRLMGLYKREAPLRLPLKTDSFKSWAERLRQYAHSDDLQKEKAYWQQLANQAIPVIPGDFSQENSVLKDTAEVSFELEVEETGHLLTRVHQAFGTEINDILLTALGLAVNKTWDHEALLISLEGHGRENLFAEIDISRTLGWFTSEYPVWLDLSFAHDLGRQVKEIKETLRKIPHKGIGYGILKYLTPIDSEQDRAFAIKPQLSFNYLGQLEAEVKQTGLELAKEPVGQMRHEQEKRVYELDVNGLISQDRLTMSIVYSRKQYKAETIDTLSAHFRAELLRVIAFCVSKEAREYTPADFTDPHLCPSIEALERLNRQYPGTVTDLYRLTPMQQGMLFHSVYEQASGTYFEQTSYCLQGSLEVKLVEESLNELCQRHEILRTAFVYQGVETPFQVILQERRAEFYYEDPRGLIGSRETREQWLKNFKEKDKARGFEPGKDALMRAAVIRTGEEEYEILWSFHHILMDGWCIGILNREFFEIYVARLEGREPQLAPLTPYKSYIRWLAKQDREASRAYWQTYLDSYEEAVQVPGRKIPQEPFDYKNETLQLDFDREKTLALNALAGENHVTLNVVMQTLWALLLGKYNGKEDVVFGSVVSGRPADWCFIRQGCGHAP